MEQGTETIDCLKVSSKSSPASVAGAIAGISRAVFCLQLALKSFAFLLFPTSSSMGNIEQQFVFLLKLKSNWQCLAKIHLLQA